MSWNPYGVLLEISATAGAVTRTSATTFSVEINAAWETYYSGANTVYGMKVSSGGKTKTLNNVNTSGNKSGSGKLTDTSYSISGNGSANKTITVTFTNFDDLGHSKSTSINLSVTVPAWTSYTVAYNANGGTGAPSSQTKWKGQALTLSSTRPTRTGYSFQGWATSASGGVAYASGASYTTDAAVTLYAVWKANTFTVTYNANGGVGAPANQTKTYGTALTLSATKPTRTNYNFKGWATSASATTAQYAAGASYTANAAVTLYAVWELAYVKPRISNLLAVRCDSNGTPDENGTSALVTFDWECDIEVDVITIYWTRTTAADKDGVPVSVSGTAGSVSHRISPVSAESTYTITVEVYDEVDYSNASTTLGGAAFPIDVKAGGDGVSFGKPAESGKEQSLGGKGVADFGFDAKFNQPVYGKVLGLDKLPAIPANAELNNYMETGCWSIQSNAIAATITCGGIKLGTDDSVPPARAGRIEISSSTGEGIRAAQWSYLRQRYLPYNASNPTLEREITRNAENVWNYQAWWKSSLTPAAAEKVYNKAAMTIALGANTVLGAVNTYTKLPFDKSAISTNDRLTLQSNAIRIGSNIQYVKVSGQILVSPGSTDGLRHARIQKVSGGTTSSVAWNTINITASKHTLLVMTPLIVAVEEGDLLQMVFYTGNASDSISSGNATNGWQTYLTVEEL